jgi:hypothetical protein
MKNGLKGVTDATVFCKSMNKGNGKNQIMRSMKSFEVGGATGLQASGAASSDSAKPPRWLRDIGTDIKRGIRKIKNNMQINSYQKSKSKNTKSKSPGNSKLRNQQKSENHKCTGAKGCI